MSALPWSATLRAVEADRRGARLPGLLAAAALLGAWLGWALLGEVAVTVESDAATVEPLSPPCLLTVPADGVLAVRSLALGQHVQAGELLASLDSRDLASRLTALAARRTALLAEEWALAGQEAAARSALDEDRGAQVAAAGERQERARRAGATATAAEEARAREARLAAAGLLAAADAARSRAEAEQRRRAAAAAALGADAGARQGRAALADRAATVERVAGELARVRGELAALAGETATAGQAMAMRSVRAPAAGRIADAMPAQPGVFVTRGARLATLVPDGPVRVVASFPAAAGAAVRPGQRAWVHLAAGPVSAAAVLPAVVAAAAPAARGGGWEVQLGLPAGATAGWTPARPGLACRVEVELGRATPAALALRALGRAGRRAPGPREAAP
jgi:multidrug resistance efflux pump